MTVPQDLIERVRGLTGPDRELDEAIALALCDEHFFAQLADAPDGVGCEMYRFGQHSPHSALRVTASIDAAFALAERVLPGWKRSLFEKRGRGWVARVSSPRWATFTSGEDDPMSTAPLALTLATLIALQSSEQSK